MAAPRPVTKATDWVRVRRVVMVARSSSATTPRLHRSLSSKTAYSGRGSACPMQALEAELLGGENPILPVLMADELPPWASSMTGTSICILPSDYLYWARHGPRSARRMAALKPAGKYRLARIRPWRRPPRMMWTRCRVWTTLRRRLWRLSDGVLMMLSWPVVNSTIADIIS